MDSLNSLSANELNSLANALAQDRLTPPFAVTHLQRYCSNASAVVAGRALQQFADLGAQPAALAAMLRVLADAKATPLDADMVDLVWSGPESGEVPSRDTAAVLRELFSRAERHVLLAGYAIHNGREVFRALAERMEAIPELRVEMYLDIRRSRGDTTIAADLVQRFAVKFFKQDWPGSRAPEIYYDPRALEMEPSQRAALHAKCVGIDGTTAFVSSANFTEAAQRRNVEVGVLIGSAAFTSRLVNHFHRLNDTGHFAQLYSQFL